MTAAIETPSVLRGQDPQRQAAVRTLVQNCKQALEPLQREFPTRGSGFTGYTYSSLNFSRLRDPHNQAKLIRKCLPDTDKRAFANMAETWVAAKNAIEQAWGDRFDAAIVQTFGRAPQFHDYKVSGIGRDEFSREIKDELREMAHLKSFVSDVAFACKVASGSQVHSAQRWYHTARSTDVPSEADLLELAARVTDNGFTPVQPLHALQADHPRGESNVVDCDDEADEEVAIERPRG